MKRTILITGACVALGSSVALAEIAPKEVKYDGIEVAMSLTGVPGDPAAGREVFKNRKLGNCLACHENSDMQEELFHGEVGPSLDGVADRYTQAELRGILVNAKVPFEGTIMPAFYKDWGFNRVLPKFKDKPILTAQQVEDVIAYLMTLKEN